MSVTLEPRRGELAQRGVEQLTAHGSLHARALWATVNGTRYSVTISRDPYGRRDDGSPDYRWHISVAGDDVPAWRDLVAIAHELRPGVPFVVGVPPRSWWMSVHPTCLHLAETTDANLIEQWRFEANGAAPS